MSLGASLKRWGRRIFYTGLGLAILAAAAFLIWVYSGHPEELARERLIEALETALGRPVQVERVGLSWLPPSAFVQGLHAEGPLVSARRVEASLSIRALLRGRILIKEIDAYEPVLKWDVDTERFMPPRPQGRPPGRVASRVDLQRIRLHGARIEIGSTVRTFNADLEGLSVQAANQAEPRIAIGPAGVGGIGYKGPWEGSVVFGRALVVWGDLTVRLEKGGFAFTAGPESILTRKIRLRAEGLDITGEGQVQPGRPPLGSFGMSARLDPDTPAVTRPLHQFGARSVELEALVTMHERGTRVSAGFTAWEPTVDLDRDGRQDGPSAPWPGSIATGTFTVEAGRVEVSGRIDDFAGGVVEGTYIGERDVAGPAGTAARPDAQRRNQVRIDASGLDLGVVMSHFDLPGEGSPPSSRVSGSAAMRWVGGGVASARGEASIGFEPAEGLLPLSGTASLSWFGRVVTVADSELRAPGSTILLTGVFDAGRAPTGLDLSAQLTSEDTRPLAAWIEARFAGKLGIRSGEPRPALRPTDLAGRMTAQIEVSGHAASPAVTARFSSDRIDVSAPAPLVGSKTVGSRTVGLEEEPPGRVTLPLTDVQGSMRWSGERLGLDLTRVAGFPGEGEPQLQGSASFEMDLGRGELLELKLDAARAPASLLARLAGVDSERAPLHGVVRATADLIAKGPGSGLHGPLSLTADSLSMGDLTATQAGARADLAGDALRLPEAVLTLYGGAVRASGDMTLGGAQGGRIEVSAEGIDLAALGADLGGPSLSGRLDVEGSLDFAGGAGGAGGIGVAGTLSGMGVLIAGVDPGLIRGTIGGTLDRLLLDLSDVDGTLTASAAFDMGAEPGPAIDATIQVQGLSLEEVRPLMPPDSLLGLKGDADGVVTMKGPLLSPVDIEVLAVLDRIQLVAGDYPLRNDAPLRLTVQDGFVTLAPARLLGEKTDLTLGGSLVLGGSYEVSARVEGSYDLGLLELLIPEMRAAGPGTADVRIIQRGDTIVYDGTLTLDGGTIVHPALPLPLERISGRGSFGEGGLFHVEELRFDVGGGHAVGSGWAQFEGASMPGLHLGLQGTGVRAELLPDLKAFFDADVSLDKDGNEYRFGGQVRIQRAIYARPFGVSASQLLLRGREFAPAEERRVNPAVVELDLDIVADGDVWVRNDDALIEATVRLNLGGTLEEPELAGRISALEGGSYRFRDVTYRIVGGSLDFADVTRIDPIVDIEAATRVQQYEVTLRIGGRYSKLTYELTSDPALPERDIVWLLITGNTLQDTPQEANRAFAEAQVASYLAAPVAGAVSAPLEKALGVSSFQIDPFFLNGTADPTARVTVTKRVAENLLFTYSSSLGQSGQEIYQIEFNPGRLWDLIGTRDLDGSVGADVRIRRRWRQWGWGDAAGAPGPEQGGKDTGAAKAATMRVGAVDLVADQLADSRESLLRLVRLDPGDPLVRGDLLEGRERLRQRYVQRGFPAAQVDVVEADPDPDLPHVRDIKYVIRAGPRHSLRIEGDVRTRPIRRAVFDVWQEPILLEDLSEEARRAALDHLKSEGHHTATVAAQVTAPEPDRRIVSLNVHPGPEVHVRRIVIEGDHRIPEERIRRQLLTRESGFLTLFGGGLLKEDVLKEDVDAIRGLYFANGYLSVRIHAPEIALSADSRDADVTIRIDEGPQSRIGALSIEGDVPGMAEEELLAGAGLSLTQVITPQTMDQAADRLREALDKNGYAGARIDYRLEGAEQDTRVVFSVIPAGRLRVNEVRFVGNTRTRDRVVEREIALDRGDHLSRAATLKTQRNLYRLGVFRSVQIETTPVEGKPGYADVLIRLEEGSPILTAWGVGYDTEDKIRGTFELANNNLFGTRRSAGLFLRGSSVDRRVQLTLRDPNLFGERIETLLSGFWEEQELESFSLRRTGISGQLSRELTDQLTLFGRYRLEDVDLFDVLISEATAGQQTVRLGSAAASVAYDSRDDIINPRRGGLRSFDARIYHSGLGSEATFTRFFGSASFFKSLGPNVVWASSIRAGVITSNNIPVSERFFAGGDTTLRGFDFNKAGPAEQVKPLDDDNDPNTPLPPLDPGEVNETFFEATGGEGLFLINQELRFPIFKALKGAVFYDMGNVFADISDYNVTDLRHVAGIGLRFDTPVGPFRIEYGRKLDHETIFVLDDPSDPDSPGRFIRKPEERGKFFFSIGHAF